MADRVEMQDAGKVGGAGRRYGSVSCPQCGGASRVLNTRHKGHVTKRYRECVACGFRFNTREETEE